MKPNKSSLPPGLRNHWWNSFFKIIGNEKTIIIAVIAVILGNGILSWSWTNCAPGLGLNISKQNGRYKFGQPHGFRNTGGKSGFLEDMTAVISEENSGKVIGTFQVDSLKIGNNPMEAFSEAEIKAGTITKGQFNFKQQSDEAIIWKPKTIYKIVFTITTVAQVAYFTRTIKSIKPYIFTLSDSDIQAIGQDSINNVRTITLVKPE